MLLWSNKVLVSLFLSSTLYNQARNRLFNELLMIDQINIIDTQCLLLGSETIHDTLNKKIVLVHNYIRESSRFD